MRNTASAAKLVCGHGSGSHAPFIHWCYPCPNISLGPGRRSFTSEVSSEALLKASIHSQCHPGPEPVPRALLVTVQVERRGPVRAAGWGKMFPEVHGEPYCVSSQPGNGQYCYPLTVTAQASRFLLLCEALESTKEKGAFEACRQLFRERGLPAAIRPTTACPSPAPTASTTSPSSPCGGSGWASPSSASSWAAHSRTGATSACT